MPTPLYDSLTTLAGEHPLRLNMPGHHGGPVPGLSWPSALDFTENCRTGDLFGSGGDAIEAAESLWAKAMGFDACLFLTGGSTQGIHAGLALLAGAGGAVALDRDSHRSAYNAMGLLDLRPRYLVRPWLEEEAIAGPIDPSSVASALENCPEISTVCITSPSYYGVLSNIPAIAAVCHAHGARLMVDGAHGAHLPFLGDMGLGAVDVAVVSTHKTLPAPGQTALLLANGFSMEELRRVGSIYGSSSPSYPMMAALDLVRDYMEGEGAARYRTAAELVGGLRRRWPCLCGRAGLTLDPTRFTLRCGNGYALEEKLFQNGVIPEMADRGHVVFIFTCADTPKEVERLEAVLTRLGVEKDDISLPSPPPQPPETLLTPRQAMFAPRRKIPWEEAAGQIAACQLAPYPPGVPVVAPGERITTEHLTYLRKIGYSGRTIDVAVELGDEKRRLRL